MKSTFFHLSVLTLLVCIGCQEPCTKTTSDVGYYGDTTYFIRAYPNCSDTLSYYEKHVKKDSTIISEGAFLNGKKDGDWKTTGYFNATTSYKNGQKTAILMFSKKGNLIQEKVLSPDSLFIEKSYYKDGTLESEGFQTMDEYLTGHGVEYDTLGRKSAEGEYIAEPVLTDTLYIESPEPPHDLQMTIVTENGGKHGPWILYDIEGDPSDTLMYDRGVLLGEGNALGKTETSESPSDPSLSKELPEKKSPSQ